MKFCRTKQNAKECPRQTVLVEIIIGSGTQIYGVTSMCREAETKHFVSCGDEREQVTQVVHMMGMDERNCAVFKLLVPK